MKAAALISAAIMLAAPAVALANELPNFEWSQATSPDGRATTQIPCRADQLKIDKVGINGFRIDCQVEDQRFVMLSGLPSITKSDEGRVNDFDALYARVKSGPLADRATLSTIGGHRAITLGCDRIDSYVCMVVVDQVPGRPLAIGYAGENDDFQALSPTAKAQLFDVIQKFVQSLELHDK